MTYSAKRLDQSTEKNFLVVLEPAKIITSWTLDSGSVYYHDFSISTNFLEYVSAVSSDGTKLTAMSSSPTANKYWWDWDNKRLYINISADPATKTIVVFFELFLGTKTFNYYRDPDDSNSEVVYYSPRVKSATIPKINQTDILAFGTSQGSINIINSDGAFYIYNDASFKNKNIKIYHVIDSTSNIEQIFTGKTEDLSINDSSLKIRYRSKDYIFNNQINSYLPTGSDASKGFFNNSDFANLETLYDGYAIRTVYGVVDDAIPINIDYNITPATNNNRDFVCRADASNAHQLNYTVQASPASTTTRIYIDSGHFLQVGDSIKVTISAVPEYTSVTARGANYVDVSPAITAPGSGDTVDRGTIGYVKIKDQDGNFYNLAYGRDYTEQTFSNNTLGFTLADNFEANHSPINVFDPNICRIYCRIYGKKHATTNDSQYGNMTAANLILIDLLTNYIGFTTDDYNSSVITALSTQKLGFSIPDRLQTVFPTYRDIIKNINRSIIGQIKYDDDNKLSYRLIAPMGATTYTLTDRELLSFGVDFEGDDIHSQITVFFNKKESPNGSLISSRSRKNLFSDKASYLHEVESSLDIDTYLLDSSEVDTIAQRYLYIYEDWQRLYSIKLKTQLHEAKIGDIITIDREKLVGNEYSSGTTYSKDMVITGIKKALTNNSIDANDQKNIEDNSGGW